MADRYVSVPMNLSDRERRDGRVKIFRRISLITTIVQNDHMRQDNARGEEHISASPLSQGARPQRSPILGFPFIYAHTLWRRTTRFGVVTHMGRELAFRGFDMAHPNGRGHSAPQFWGLLSIYAHTLCRRTTKLGVVTYMEMGVF